MEKLLAQAASALKSGKAPQITIANHYINRGTFYYESKRYSEAREAFEAALSIYEEHTGPQGGAAPLEGLGVVAAAQGDDEAAIAYCERALGLRVELLGADHPRTARSFANVGQLRMQAGDLKGAARAYESALNAYGERSKNVQTGSLHNLSSIYFDLGQLSKAQDRAERAIAMQEALDPKSSNIVTMRRGAGKIYSKLGEYKNAINHFEKSLVQVVENKDSPKPEVARARFDLAKCLWDAPTDQGQDRPRARAEALKARDGYRGVESSAKELAEVEAWLMEVRPSRRR